MSLFEKVRLLGQRRDKQELRTVVQKVATEHVKETIKENISHLNFSVFLQYLLEGLGKDGIFATKRQEYILAVLDVLKNGTVSDSQTDSIMSIFAEEVRNLDPDLLVDLCSHCITSIQAGNSASTSWKDLLPVSLNILSSADSVEYNGNIITGLEYKSQLIDALIMMEWDPNICTTLACTFSDIDLSKKQHLQVCEKLSKYIGKLKPQEVPPFVYQLLQFCKSQNGRTIFLKLQSYFNEKIYNNENLLANSESLDFIGDASDQDYIHCESNILYHIHQNASLHLECVNDYIKSSANSTKCPEYVLHPFQLTVLLTLSTVPLYESKIMDIIKSAVSRTYLEEHKKLKSCWFREMVPAAKNLTTVFVNVVNFSLQDREMVLQGLLNVAFLFIGSGAALGKEHIAEKMWNIGTVIITKLLKYKKNITHVILQRLTDCILGRESIRKYTDCLLVISKNFAHVILENKSTIINLIDQLITVSNDVAGEILKAILPLTKISVTIRDHLVLLLKKALYTDVLEIRKIAVSGFLELLQCAQISDLAAFSQGSMGSSCFSVYTQISLSHAGHSNPGTFSNEAVCLEVLNILSQCLKHQEEIKVKLYDGMNDAVSKNPQVGTTALSMFVSHLNSFLVTDEEIVLPLDLTKIVQIKYGEAVLEEIMGKLIYVTSSILGKVTENESMLDETVTVRASALLDNLCTKLAQCELEHFTLDDGTDLLDTLPESQEKLLILKESILTYEALMVYAINSWTSDNNNAEKVLRLYQGLGRLIAFSKTLSKPKKGEKRKDANKTTQSQTQPGKSSATRKSFKAPDTLFDVATLRKLISLLYMESVPWASGNDSERIRTNVAFHQYVLNATINMCVQLKQRKLSQIKKQRDDLNPLCDVAKTLYTRCVVRFKDLMEFDSDTAVTALEAFYAILQVMNAKFDDSWPLFLSTVLEKPNNEDESACLSDILEKYQELFSTIDNDTAHDAESVRFAQVLIQTISLLGSLISYSDTSLSNKLLDWMKEFAATKDYTGKAVVNLFFTYYFAALTKFKLTSSVFTAVSNNLCEILETIQDTTLECEPTPLLNEATAPVVLNSLCAELKSMLDDIDWVIARIGTECSFVPYTSADNRKQLMSAKEKSVCCQLSQVITISTLMNKMKIPPGSQFETLTKNNIHLYNTLTGLIKYFLIRIAKVDRDLDSSRIELVVKQVGRKLSPAVYELVALVEESKNESGKAKKNASSARSKVLREVKSLPKLVYEMEQFSKTVDLLSKRSSVDLAKYVGQGSSRDFRIMNLDEQLQQGSGGDAADGTADDSTIISDEETETTEETGLEDLQPKKKRKSK